MMDINEALADFQFLKNRVTKFSVNYKTTEIKEKSALINCDIDYDIVDFIEDDSKFIGIMNFIVDLKAKAKNLVIFKMHLNMEGTFVGNPKKLNKEQFMNMLELNGVATLSQFSRSYISSVSTLSGINPPVNLPMINIHTLREFKLKKEEKRKNNS